MPSGIITVIGTDGETAVYNPDGLWKLWSINEIWQGGAAAGKYVPKVDDYIIDPELFMTWIVESLDNVTLIPTLREIRPANMSYSLSESDLLFGVGPGTQADTYRVYLDQSVTPHVLAVDIRLKIAGTMASYAKLFKGSDVSGSGHVISKVYDSMGNFISENIPLELVAIDSHNNYSIKTISVCHCLEDLVDGELVTAVIYNDQGHVVSKRQLLIENTAFIRSINVSQKYVSHISIESAFLSPTEINTIRFPLNIPLNALNVIGIVHYSDGSSLRLPIDGNKFRLFGLEQFVSSIVGQQIELVLSYALAPNEVSYAGVSADGHYVTEPYHLVTINPNNSYTVKLFGYPIWVSEADGYVMKWWLFNLDRNVFFDVTPYVQFSAQTGAFNPKGYGYLQRKAVNINLRDISAAFQSFVHVQLVDIVLQSPPDSSTNVTAWTVSHESMDTRPSFGVGLYARRNSVNVVNLASGLDTEAEWLEKMYLQTYPLLDRTSELSVPNPTHFIVTINNQMNEFAIGQWNQNLLLSLDPAEHSTLSVRFIRRTSSGDLQLAIAAVMVKY